MKTEILEISITEPQRDRVEHAAELLKQGKTVIIPTETVYGLAANALDENAAKGIFEAKGRPADNPLIVHVSDIGEIPVLVSSFPEAAKKLFEAFSPGPLTVVMEKSEIVPEIVSGGLSTVAVRIPSHPVARAIISASGLPLAAPSANISGRPSPTRISHLKDMMGRVDLIVDSGPCDVGLESTVVSVCKGEPKLLRPGFISLEQLKRILPEITVDKAVKGSVGETEKVASPGMKYRHYAPSCEMYLATGEDSADIIERQAADFIARGQKPVIICFEEYKNRFAGFETIILGGERQYETQAKRLFDCLLRADELHADVILAQCPPPVGVGLAVYNRMLKAAGHKFI